MLEAISSTAISAGQAASRATELTGIIPERIIREGNTADEMLKLIDEDEDIAILILAASCDDSQGPGPLVSSLAKSAGTFPIPITIVPGNLTLEELQALA